MDILIRRLPDSTTHLDLRHFVISALNPKWYQFFSKPIAHLVSCSIFEVTDTHTHSVESHGLVRIEPASAGVEIIRKLNGRMLNGKEMEVRKFYRRAISRDRRQETSDLPQEILDQRKSDRRRLSLEITSVTAGVTHESQKFNPWAI
ncbi:MAG: hypothetical protein ABW079_12445 [Sedimenticola sp.]